MVLVLTILALVAGVSWPLLDRQYADRRLLRAAEDVRQVLAAARLDAIDAGVAHRFLYEQGGRTYLIERDGIGAAATSAAIDVQGRVVTGSAAGVTQELRELPENFVFQSESSIGAVASMAPAAGTWSTPVPLQPDGSAADAAFRVIDMKRYRSVRIAVRGLTGTVRVDQTVREVQP
jgi:Tfp pilus assembly protein FimT